MNTGKISTTVGCIVGWFTAAATKELITAIAVAFFTGAAAWIGQVTAKYLFRKAKSFFKIK